MATARRSRKARGFLVHKPQGTLTPRVQAVGPEHFGIVSIDCAKARSKFFLCTFYGQVLIEPTVLEHTQAAFRAALERVRGAVRDHGLRDVVVAIESTGTYHRPVQHAFRSAGFDTRLVHPFASKHFRQPADPGNKTDDTDLAAIFRATVNGFGLMQPTWPGVYLELQQLCRQRRDLVHKTTTLRCQIKETLHQLLPGYTALFAEHFFDTPVALPLARATGSAQAVLDAGLDGLRRLVPQGLRYKMTTLVKVLDWARTATPAQEPCQLYRESLDRLADDFLKKTSEIRGLEQRSARLLAQTPFLRLLALPGICVVSAAELAGEQGPPEGYANANHLTGRAGLCPSRYQSDQVDCANGPLRRHGNRRLRAALLQIANNLSRHNHHFQARAAQWKRQGKDLRWIRVKVAKIFSRLLFVLLTGEGLVPHPACQPRHSICDKLMGFHIDHQTDLPKALEDIALAARQLSGRTCREETELLRQQLHEPRRRHGCGRRRGPVPLAELIPQVLARLGVRMLQSQPEGEDPS
jgi:transposase